MRPTLVVLFVVVCFSFSAACNSGAPPADAATSAPVTTPVASAPAPSTSTPTPTTSHPSGRWTVVRKTNPMNDAETLVATSRVKGDEGTYELQFSLAKDEFAVDYTIYDAEPLGLQPDLNGTNISFHKNLQWRFDKQDSNVVVAERDKQYANRFRLTTLDDAFARMGATNVRTTWGSLTNAKTIVVQGLRDPAEFLEFPLDESFEPFRTIVAGTIASGSAGASATPSGVTASVKDNVFLLNGRPTDPEIEGEVELTIDKHLQFKNGDLFLLKNRAGSQCPTSYFIVFKDASRTMVTPEFGTCAIASDVSEKDGVLIVTMPDTAHTVYRFDGSTLLENGKPFKH